MLVVLSALILLPLRELLPLLAAPAILLSYAGAAVVAFRWGHVQLLVAGPLLSFTILAAAAWIVRRWMWRRRLV